MTNIKVLMTHAHGHLRHFEYEGATLQAARRKVTCVYKLPQFQRKPYLPWLVAREGSTESY